jgi:hypothetical protein
MMMSQRGCLILKEREKKKEEEDGHLSYVSSLFFCTYFSFSLSLLLSFALDFLLSLFFFSCLMHRLK